MWDRLIRLAPSPALVISCIALAISLGGTAYAALTLPAGSVGSRQIQAGAVNNSRLAANAVRSSNVKNGSLKAKDFAPGNIPSRPGPTGAEGARGAKGETGAKGNTGGRGDDGSKGDVGPKGDTGSKGVVGPKGDVGVAGAPGTALGFAKVSPMGYVTDAKNVITANVTVPVIGTYCFSGLPFTPKNVIAVTSSSNGGPVVASTSAGPFNYCTAPGVQAEVITYTQGAATTLAMEAAAFQVLFN